MSARLWVKLWIEILNDRKMQKLPDHIWRFIVECYLAAGAIGDEYDEGFLSAEADVGDLAFILHRPEEQVKALIKETLSITDILTKVPFGDPDTNEPTDEMYVMVRKFKDRQKVPSSTERSRYSRAQK